jgi:hypothetical protein
MTVYSHECHIDMVASLTISAADIKVIMLSLRTVMDRDLSHNVSKDTRGTSPLAGATKR